VVNRCVIQYYLYLCRVFSYMSEHGILAKARQYLEENGGNDLVLSAAEAAYVETATNPFYEDNPLEIHKRGRIPDHNPDNSFPVTLTAEGSITCVVADALAMKLMLPGPVDSGAVKDPTDTHTLTYADSGSTAIQAVNYKGDGILKASAANVTLKWDKVSAFREYGMKYRVVGCGLKVYAQSANESTSGTIAAGHFDKVLIPTKKIVPASTATIPWPPVCTTDGALVWTGYEGSSPAVVDLQNNLDKKRYPLNRESGMKDGCTVRGKSNGDEDLVYFPLGDATTEYERERSKMPIVVAYGTSATTVLYVTAVLHMEVLMEDFNRIQESSPSPFSPKFDLLYYLVNSDLLQPFVTSGHSFFDVLQKAGAWVGKSAKDFYKNKMGGNLLDAGAYVGDVIASGGTRLASDLVDFGTDEVARQARKRMLRKRGVSGNEMRMMAGQAAKMMRPNVRAQYDDDYDLGSIGL